jgi:hypothetical protein
MKIKSKDYRLQGGEKIDIKKRPTLVKPAYKSKKNTKNASKITNPLQFRIQRVAVLVIELIPPWLNSTPLSDNYSASAVLVTSLTHRLSSD